MRVHRKLGAGGPPRNRNTPIRLGDRAVYREALSNDGALLPAEALPERANRVEPLVNRRKQKFEGSSTRDGANPGNFHLCFARLGFIAPNFSPPEAAHAHR